MDTLSIKELRNNIRAFRIKNDYSQADVAVMLGISLRAYKYWEQAPNKMTFEKLAKLAEIYKCSVKDFFL